MPLIRFLAPTKIQAAIYAEGQIVLFQDDLAYDVLSSGLGEEVTEAYVFIEHINRIEEYVEPPLENPPEG